MNLLIPLGGEQTKPERSRVAPSASGLWDSIHLYPFQLGTAIHGIAKWGVASPTESNSKLETLKRRRFTTQGRAERIEKSLAALNQPETLKLTPQEWHFFAEDPDLDDQD